MEEENQEHREEDHKRENWVKLAILAVIAFIIFIIAWAKNTAGRKKLKSELAAEYGVSTKVLMNWVDLICPDKVRQLYVGEKVKKIVPAKLFSHIGRPVEIPKDLRGRSIRNRKEICRFLNIERSTLNRRLREIENPDEEIGMPYKTFVSLKLFPPKQVNLILSYMQSRGYPKK